MHNLTDEIIQKRREILYKVVSDDLRNKIAQHLSFEELGTLLPDHKSWNINTILEHKNYEAGRKIINAIVNKLIDEDVRSHVRVLYDTLVSVKPGVIEGYARDIARNESQITQLMKITDAKDEIIRELTQMCAGNSTDIKFMQKQIEAMQKQINELKKNKT